MAAVFYVFMNLFVVASVELVAGMEMTQWDGFSSDRATLALGTREKATIFSRLSRHADNESIYGPQPTIASAAWQISELRFSARACGPLQKVTLGAERDFDLKECCWAKGSGTFLTTFKCFRSRFASELGLQVSKVVEDVMLKLAGWRFWRYRWRHDS